MAATRAALMDRQSCRAWRRASTRWRLGLGRGVRQQPRQLPQLVCHARRQDSSNDAIDTAAIVGTALSRSPTVRVLVSAQVLARL